MILHLADLETGNSNGGRMWISIGDCSFPEEGWYDLPGILLEYWKKDLCAFANGETNSCELFFMDGPYCVKIQRAEEGVTAACMCSGSIAIDPVNIDFDAFWNSVRNQ